MSVFLVEAPFCQNNVASVEYHINVPVVRYLNEAALEIGFNTLFYKQAQSLYMICKLLKEMLNQI